MKKFAKIMTVLVVIAAIFAVPASLGKTDMTAYASHKAISFKEGKKLLKKAGYRGELGYAKLSSKSKKKTVIVTYPGAKGKDIFTLKPSGKHVKIHAVFGTLDGGHFSTINYINLPHNKTVKR